MTSVGHHHLALIFTKKCFIKSKPDFPVTCPSTRPEGVYGLPSTHYEGVSGLYLLAETAYSLPYPTFWCFQFCCIIGSDQVQDISIYIITNIGYIAEKRLFLCSYFILISRRWIIYFYLHLFNYDVTKQTALPVKTLQHNGVLS